MRDPRPAPSAVRSALRRLGDKVVAGAVATLLLVTAAFDTRFPGPLILHQVIGIFQVEEACAKSVGGMGLASVFARLKGG